MKHQPPKLWCNQPTTLQLKLNQNNKWPKFQLQVKRREAIKNIDAIIREAGESEDIELTWEPSTEPELMSSDKFILLTGDGLNNKEPSPEHEESLILDISHTSEDNEDWRISDGWREEHLPEEEQCSEEEELPFLELEESEPPPEEDTFFIWEEELLLEERHILEDWLLEESDSPSSELLEPEPLPEEEHSSPEEEPLILDGWPEEELILLEERQDSLESEPLEPKPLPEEEQLLPDIELISLEEEHISPEEEPLSLEEELLLEPDILDVKLTWEEEDWWLPEEELISLEEELSSPETEELLTPDISDTLECSLTEEELPTLDTEPILEELLPLEEELGWLEREHTSDILPTKELLPEDTESTWWREEDISHGWEEWREEPSDSSNTTSTITDEEHIIDLMNTSPLL